MDAIHHTHAQHVCHMNCVQKMFFSPFMWTHWITELTQSWINFLEACLSIMIRCPFFIGNGRQVECYVLKPGFIRAYDMLAWVVINSEGVARNDMWKRSVLLLITTGHIRQDISHDKRLTVIMIWFSQTISCMTESEFYRTRGHVALKKWKWRESL